MGSMGQTKEYLNQHLLQQHIQVLIQDVLRQQPENPYEYMLEQLKRDFSSKINEAGGTAYKTAPPVPAPPMVPKPPDKPCPAKKGRNFVAGKRPSNEDVNPPVSQSSTGINRFSTSDPARYEARIS